MTRCLPACMAIFLAVALGPRVRAAESNTNVVCRALVESAEGSRVIGILRSRSIPVLTEYGVIRVPSERILDIDLRGGATNSVLRLRNGDRLTGVLEFPTLNVSTLAGEIAFPVGAIANVRVSLAGGTGLPDDLRKGLILYYTFDLPGPVVPDDSNNGHNGTIMGAEWNRYGRLGGALDFNGVEGMVIGGEMETSSFTDELTVCVWFKRRRDGANLYLVSGHTEGTASDGFSLYHSSAGPEREDRNGANLYFASRDAAGTGTDGFALYHSTAGAERGYKAILKDEQQWTGCWTYSTKGFQEDKGRWVHLAMVYDGNALVLYRNGREISRDSACRGRVAFAAPKVAVRVGDFMEGGHEAGGFIDEVMIYSRALAPADIKRIVGLAR